MNELLIQFEKEEAVWKRKIEDLAEKHQEIMNCIIDDMPVKDVLWWIDIATIISDQMKKLDTNHKIFLLDWHKKVTFFSQF